MRTITFFTYCSSIIIRAHSSLFKVKNINHSHHNNQYSSLSDREFPSISQPAMPSLSSSSSKSTSLRSTTTVMNSNAEVVLIDINNDIIDGVNWIDLKILPKELRPDYTLIMGQCFQWKKIKSTISNNVSWCWIGMLDSYPLAIRQTDSTTLFANLLDNKKLNTKNNRFILTPTERKETNKLLSSILKSYFQTNYNLEELYGEWSAGCGRMKVVTECLSGVRVVRQDPFECLISFICSSNNNIKRITMMLDRLRCKYGRYKCTVSLNTSGDSSSSSNGSGKSNSNEKGRHLWQVNVYDNQSESVRTDIARTLLSRSAGSSLQSPDSKLETDSVQNTPISIPTASKTHIKIEKNEKFTSTDFQSPVIIKNENGIKIKSEIKAGIKSEIKLEIKSEIKSEKSIIEETLQVDTYHLYDFPTIENLSKASEVELRNLGMGYRAKFISGSSLLLLNKEQGGAQWLESLRHMGEGKDGVCSVKLENVKSEDSSSNSSSSSSSKKRVRGSATKVKKETSLIELSSRLKVQNCLMELPGVGKKVADCVALFSLDQQEAIPVDTHVWSIALRDYDPSQTLAGAKSLTPVVYEQVGQIFRDKFPLKAGWAHSVLFAAELPEFKIKLPSILQNEMKNFANESKIIKKNNSNEKLIRKKEKLKLNSLQSIQEKIDDDDDENDENNDDDNMMINKRKVLKKEQITSVDSKKKKTK